MAALSPERLEIIGDYITLGQALKLSGAVETGSEAKAMVSSGGATVNGVTETRRGRKLRPGDRFEANGRVYAIVGNESP